MYLKRKDVLPCIRNVVDWNAAEYKVEVCTEVRLDDNSWSGGGTRYTYRGVNLETGEVKYPESDEYGNPFTNPEVPTVILQPGFAIVKFGCFCGKKMCPTVFLHPDNATKLLESNNPELTFNERAVLVYTRSLKNSYGGEKDIRFRDANKDLGISREEWNKAQASLIERKMLNKRGSITADGKNAVGFTQTHELKTEYRG